LVSIRSGVSEFIVAFTLQRVRRESLTYTGSPMSQQPSKFKRGFAISACAAVVAIAAAGEESRAVEQMEKYCVASWRNARILQQDWSDCTQQTLTELLERVPRERLACAIDDKESIERRELNRTIWRVIQRARRAVRHQSLAGSDAVVAADVSDAEVDLGEFGEIELEAAMTAAGLKRRQQRILAAWSQGRKVAEIAEELGISPARVSDEKYKAIQSLRKLLSTTAA
jgi:DNA-directed RNA polymerase specialized sigma24 family protein